MSTVGSVGTVGSSQTELRRDALAIFQSALEAADAGNAVRRHLPSVSARIGFERFDRISLIAVGKAAASMALAVAEMLGSQLTRTLVVTKHGHVTAPLPQCTVIEAGHPVPDLQSFYAAELALQWAKESTERDLLLLAISGGASALLAAPADDISLADKQQTTDVLLRAGATINELNAVRKHLSRIKGGKLAAAAWPGTVVSLILSDVIGDPLDVIGSGLTAPDPTTFADAAFLLRSLPVPARVRQYLASGVNGVISETPKPGDSLFEGIHNFIVGSNRLALEAAANAAGALGYQPFILSSSMHGETREVARVHASILREVVLSGHPAAAPACLLSGGETTVTVRGQGKGGRNLEFALAAAIEIAGLPNVGVLSAGTDGTDGPTDAAGAFATGETIERAVRMGISASDHLLRNDSYPFFDALGDLIKTGPTGTNVMDIHIMLVQTADSTARSK